MQQDNLKKNEEVTGTKRPFPLYEVIGVIVGAIGGFLYYHYYGCVTGSCPITSNPWITTIWGAVMGYLVVGIFKPSKKRKKEIVQKDNF
jgi:H+/Cl- antiporter ClcA